MRKRILALVAVSGLVLLVSAPVEAGRAKQKPTKIEVTSTDFNPGTTEVVGDLLTAKRCRGERRVRVFVVDPGPRELLDETRSESDGTWTAFGQTFTQPARYKIVAGGKRAGSVKCRAAKAFADHMP